MSVQFAGGTSAQTRDRLQRPPLLSSSVVCTCRQLSGWTGFSTVLDRLTSLLDDNATLFVASNETTQLPHPKVKQSCLVLAQKPPTNQTHTFSGQFSFAKIDITTPVRDSHFRSYIGRSVAHKQFCSPRSGLRPLKQGSV